MGKPTVGNVKLFTCKLSKREMNGDYPPEGVGRRTPVILIETAQHPASMPNFDLPATKLLNVEAIDNKLVAARAVAIFQFSVGIGVMGAREIGRAAVEPG